MSDYLPQAEPPKRGSSRVGHEGTDLSLGPIFGFGVGLIVAAVAIYLLLGWLMSLFVADSKRSEALRPPLYKDERGQFPPPNTPYDPKAYLAEFRARERKALTTYGWVDREKGIAHVPIDRALDILAERGLPKVKNITPKGGKGPVLP